MTTPPPAQPVTLPVRLQPSRICPALGQGVQGNVYNNDITNIAYVGYQQNLSPTNSIAIQPLGNAVVDLSRQLWGYAPVGNPILSIVPGGGAQSASPAQVALQIAALGLAKDASVNAPGYGPITTSNPGTLATAGGLSTINTTLGTPAQDSIRTGIPNNISTTGVPLLALSTVILQTGATHVAAGATVNSAVLNHNQIGYHLNLTLQENVAGTTQTVVSVTFNWIDSVTGLTVASDVWHILPAAPGGAVHAIAGNGPTKGNQLQISITNHDTVQVNYNLNVVINSRVYGKNDWRTLSVGTFTGLTNSAFDPNSQIIADSNLSIAASGTNVRALPLYAGSVVVHSRGANTMLVFITSLDPNAQAFGQIVDQDTTAGKSTVTLAYLPQAQCLLNITNTGSTTANCQCAITGRDII